MTTVIVGITTAIFSALLTFFVTTIAYKNKFEALKRELALEIKAAIATHNEIKHQDSMYVFVGSEIKKHESQCNGGEKIARIEKALVYMITLTGGNPKDAGL